MGGVLREKPPGYVVAVALSVATVALDAMRLFPVISQENPGICQLYLDKVAFGGYNTDK